MKDNDLNLEEAIKRAKILRDKQNRRSWIISLIVGFSLIALVMIAELVSMYCGG